MEDTITRRGGGGRAGRRLFGGMMGVLAFTADLSQVLDGVESGLSGHLWRGKGGEEGERVEEGREEEKPRRGTRDEKDGRERSDGRSATADHAIDTGRTRQRRAVATAISWRGGSAKCTCPRKTKGGDANTRQGTRGRGEVEE